MGSRLLLDWLNEEVKLSRMITSLDEDFRDGYLLGELLKHYNQQDDFHLFDQKDTPETKIRNFCLLEPTLRRLEIPFNFKLAYDIIDGKHGVMKALLSELRAVLDRVKKNSQPPIATVGQGGKIMRIMSSGKAVYDQSMSASFEKSMRIMMENPTEALIKKAVTNRFIALGAELREQATQAFTEAVGSMQMEQQRQKEIFRHRKRHEGEFAKAWDLLNVEQWKTNQTRAINRKSMTARLVQEQVTRQEQRRSTAMMSAREATFSSIDDFDRRIEREVFREDPVVAATLGASLKKTIAGATGSGVPELSYVDKVHLEEGLVTALKKLKEHHDDGLIKQQSHDRRRRKFVREREFTQANCLQNSAESEIIFQLLNQCESEVVEARARERVLAQKDIMTVNRTKRQAIIDSINASTGQRLVQWNNEEAEREKNFVITPRIESQRQRRDTLEQSRAAAERHRSTEVATEVLCKILDLTEWVLSCRHLGLHHVSLASSAAPPPPEGSREESHDDKIVPLPIWDDARVMFSASLEMATMLPLPDEINVSDDLPFRLSERPQCIGQEFLLQAPFQSHHVMAPAALLVDEDMPSANPPEEPSELVILPQGAIVPPNRVISEFLSLTDSQTLLAAIGSVELPSFEAPNEVVEVEAVDNVVQTPRWLLSMPPKYLLGEVVSSVRCTSEPLPLDGTASVALPALFFRGLIIGVSEMARHVVARALHKAMPTLCILRVQDLVHEYSAIAAEVALAKADDSRETEEQVAVPEITVTEKHKLATLLSSHLQAGLKIPDSVYVTLLVQAICSLPEGAGYVIEDFPSTKKQLSLLMESLSGINYEEEKPSPADRASALAPLLPVLRPPFDSAKCGLDKVILVDAGDADTLVADRIRIRSDCLNQGTVQVNDATTSVSYLQELYTPLRPVHTFSVDVSVSSAELTDLAAFVDSMNLLTSVTAAGFASLDDAAGALAAEIEQSFTTKSIAKEEKLSDEQVPPLLESVPGNGEGEENIPQPAESSELPIATIPVAPPPSFVELPKQLADALTSIWSNTEAQLEMSSRGYFCSLRDLRYQMLQRRRGLHDVIYRLLIRRDERQELFEAFRTQFNAILTDFRFDEDCIAEMHLRSLEMGNAVTGVCDKRRKEAEAQLTEFMNDGLVQVAVHRTQCEGAALLQSLLNCFLASVHVLLDVAKALAKYDKTERVCNPLEETLPAAFGEAIKAPQGKDAKGGAKDPKAKGGKDAPAVPVPFREPVPGIVLPADLMATLPGVKVVEPAEAVDPKAKGKAPDKGKKGSEEVAPSDAFEVTEKAVLEALDAWSQGAFTVSRAVYSDDEAVCASIEKAIWHEAERLKFSLSALKDSGEKQIAWLNSMDANIKDIMEKLIEARHARELASTVRLLEMVGESIENAAPIREQWLVASDVITVHPCQLILAPEPDAPEPGCIDFFESHLNEEQLQILQMCLSEITTGEVVLEHDVLGFVTRILDHRAGPLGTIRLSKTACLSHLVLPGAYRRDVHRFLESLAPKTPVRGTDEHLGVVAAHHVKAALAKIT